jgi:hypothetical protein
MAPSSTGHARPVTRAILAIKEGKIAKIGGLK